MAFGYNTFHTGFSFFGIIWLIMFVLITSVFAITFFKGIKEWNKNNHSPRLTVPATVVAKRTNVSRHRHGGNDTLHTTIFGVGTVKITDRVKMTLKHIG